MLRISQKQFLKWYTERFLGPSRRRLVVRVASASPPTGYCGAPGDWLPGKEDAGQCDVVIVAASVLDSQIGPTATAVTGISLTQFQREQGFHQDATLLAKQQYHEKTPSRPLLEDDCV